MEINSKTLELAKEKGFIQPKKEVWYNPMNGFTKYEDVIPSQDFLKKWLRERPTPVIVTPTTDFVAWEVDIQHPDINPITIHKNEEGRWFNSYEEALEGGLQEALKLI